MKPEHRVGEPRVRTGQQEQLDHCQDVAGVQQPEHLPGAQLEPDLQAEGDSEEEEETLACWAILIPPITVLIIVPLQPDCPPGLNYDQQAQRAEHDCLRQSSVRSYEVCTLRAPLPRNTEVYPAVEEISTLVLHCRSVTAYCHCSLIYMYHQLDLRTVKTCLCFGLKLP